MKNNHIHVEKDKQLLLSLQETIRKRIQPISKKVRIHLAVKFIVYFLFSSVLYSSLYLVESAGLFIISFVLYGLSVLLFAFNFAHDFSHDTVFKSKKWNNFGFIALYTLVGAHAEEWKKRHINSHHHAPNVEDYDSDLQITGIIRVIPESEYRWYHRFQHIYAPFAYTSYSLFWVFVKDFKIYFGEEGMFKTGGLSYHLSFWTQKIFYLGYLLFFPIVFSGQSWGLVFLAFLIMHMVQSLFLLFTFFMTHHVEATHYPKTDSEGKIQSSWMMNQVKSSNDMHPFSPFANFILGGFNNHIAHHLFPNIHHVHYPEINKILYHVLNENGIKPNCTTYWGGIVSHLKLLKKMGQVA